MSIATEITRLQTAKADLKTSIEGKGVTVPSATLIDGYADLVDSIETGGGGISVQDLAKNTAPTGVVVLDTNVTTIGNFAFAGKPIAGIYGPMVTKINSYAFHSCPSLVKAKFPVITWLGNNNWYQFQSSNLQQAAFPKLTENLPQNIMQACSQLTTLDLGKCSSIQTKATAGATNFNTIILRKTDALTTLANVDGIASGTKFANGGAGGTIYIPTVLYDHLGDGSALDYQSATNWATVYGYGTITWEKLEGSIYESEDWLTI